MTKLTEYKHLLSKTYDEAMKILKVMQVRLI